MALKCIPSAALSDCLPPPSSLLQTLGAIQSLTLLVVCCHSVDQVLSLLVSLCKDGGGGGRFGAPVCSRITVVEIFYCLACLCYSLWNEGLLPQRLVYYHQARPFVVSCPSGLGTSLLTCLCIMQQCEVM